MESATPAIKNDEPAIENKEPAIEIKEPIDNAESATAESVIEEPKTKDIGIQVDLHDPDEFIEEAELSQEINRPKMDLVQTLIHHELVFENANLQGVNEIMKETVERMRKEIWDLNCNLKRRRKYDDSA